MNHDSTNVVDIFGNLLNPGDIIFYVSTSGDNTLAQGVYINHFDNGAGWKMRIRSLWGSYDGAANAWIKENGMASGVIRVAPWRLDVEPRFLNIIKLRDTLKQSGKIKPLDKEDDKNEDSNENANLNKIVLETIEALGAPESLKKNV